MLTAITGREPAVAPRCWSSQSAWPSVRGKSVEDITGGRVRLLQPLGDHLVDQLVGDQLAPAP